MKLIKEIIGRPSVKYTVMSAIASGLNFVTLIVWGRIFSVEDYGIATTLQAFVANVATFMIPLQMMGCSLLAGDSKIKKIEDIMSIFLFINVMELIVLVIAAGKVMQYLCFKGIIEVSLLFVLIFCNNIFSVLMGLAQGKQDFMLLGKANIILYFVKLLISTLLSFASIGPLAVLIGYTIAEIVCTAMMMRSLLWPLKMPRNIHKARYHNDTLRQYVWTFILYIAVSIYMNNGDLLMGNLYCSKAEIGLYSATMALSKISVFLIAMPIGTVAFPKMVAAKGEGRKRNKILILAEIVTLTGSCLYGICFYVLGGWFIPLIYGETYKGADQYILPSVIFSIVLGMFWVVFQYILAVELTKKFAIVTAAAGIIIVIWILMMEIELRSIPIIMAIAMILAIVGVIFSMKNVNEYY